jgi:ATP-dependent exoDNAse (exonuclease V) alpha subunit
MRDLTPEKRQELATELAELTKQQRDALKAASIFRMTDEEVRFDERLVKYDFGELDEVSLAYAITIHKSQGSEFSAVVIPLATQHYMLLQRNLIYTVITRGKRCSC